MAIEWQIRRISENNFEVWSRADKRGWVRRLDAYCQDLVEDSMKTYDEDRTRYFRLTPVAIDDEPVQPTILLKV